MTPTGADWLEKDHSYARQIVRMAGIRIRENPGEGCITFDTGCWWHDNQWVAPYWYSVPGDLGRLIWYSENPNRLFSQSLGVLSETFKEMCIPDKSIDFSGYIDPHDKKVYFVNLTLRRHNEAALDDYNERVWLRSKLMRPDNLVLGFKALQEAKRRLKGWGYE